MNQGMHDQVAASLAKLVTSLQALQSAAPTHAWDATSDAQAIASMKSSWGNAREAYESIDGAIASVFGDLETSLDERYDDALSEVGSAGDPDLLDGQVFTGLHAIERILYADAIPQDVVAFESTLLGYSPASFPTTDAEATELSSGLLAKAVSDAQELQAQWGSSKIDLAGTFQGELGMLKEQGDKMTKASAREEESRYSQTTLRDLRANLEGAKSIHALFEAWLASKGSPGAMAEANANSAFSTLENAYAGVSGDAVPTPPNDWLVLHPEMSSSADLMSPFGVLFTSVESSIDATTPTSLVVALDGVITEVGHPELVPSP